MELLLLVIVIALGIALAPFIIPLLAIGFGLWVLGKIALAIANHVADENEAKKQESA